jgi:conjugal transfer ATP-binding protein TraC
MSLFGPKTQDEDETPDFTTVADPVMAEPEPILPRKPVQVYVPPAEPEPEPMFIPEAPEQIKERQPVEIAMPETVFESIQEPAVEAVSEPKEAIEPAPEAQFVPEPVVNVQVKKTPPVKIVPPVIQDFPASKPHFKVKTHQPAVQKEPRGNFKPKSEAVRTSILESREQIQEVPFETPKIEQKKEPAKQPSFLNSFLAPKSEAEITRRKFQLQEMEKEKDISKRVVDIDKTYKEGLTTLRDLLAPASLKFESSYFELNGKFGRSFFVLAYPRFLSSNWLSFIVQAEGALDLSMFIYPIDSETILKKLKSKVGEIGSQMAINQEKGMVRDPMLETAYGDVEGLRDQLMQGTERYFRFALYFTLYADDLKELDKNSSTLESALGAKLIVTKRALMQTQDGFNSTLPLGLDELDVGNNMNTSPLSTAFPFVSSDLTGNDGILYGINRHNNSLILFDRFAMENANAVVFAKSGAGKSYAVKLEVLRSLMVGTEVIIVDPENEYKHLADAVGGTYLSVSLNSNSRINPFDLPIAIEGEDNADVLRSSIVNLLGLFSLMLGKLNPTEEALMDKALWQTYAKKDITAETDFRTAEYPTMNDLVEILSNMVGAESLAQRLTKFTEGTFAGLFNQPTNVVLNNQLVVFSIRDLEEELRPVAMYIVLGYIWNVVRSELKRRILVLDEAWIMMQHEDSARFVFGMAKRARKYYLGLSTITQDVADFMASPYGKPIVTNSSIQLLLKQSPAAINIIAETFFLTEGEKYLLLESEVGEGIFFAGLKHAAIKIYASYVEDQIITTDPKQLLEIEENQEQVNG